MIWYEPDEFIAELESRGYTDSDMNEAAYDKYAKFLDDERRFLPSTEMTAIFRSRSQAYARSRIIFHGFSKATGEKFKLYQEIIAEEQQRPEFISKQADIGLLVSTASDEDFVELPTCPECGHNMIIRLLPPQGKANLYGYKTQWICSNGATTGCSGCKGNSKKMEAACAYERPPSFATKQKQYLKLKRRMAKAVDPLTGEAVLDEARLKRKKLRGKLRRFTG